MNCYNCKDSGYIDCPECGGVGETSSGHYVYCDCELGRKLFNEDKYEML